MRRVRAWPEDGLDGKERVDRRLCSVARTDEEASSYAARSWIRERIKGTSG